MTQSTILMGKGALAIEIAEWFHDSPDHDLQLVVPVIPEPTWAPSLADWCAEHDVPIVESGRFHDIPGVRDDDWHVDVAFSCAYDLIIRQWFIDKCGRILNLHNSPLPKYRGMAPINWALKRGERMHGATIHEITAGIDDGPIVSQVQYSIDPAVDEVRDVYERAQRYSLVLFEETMPRLHDITPYEQDHDAAEYFTAEMSADLGDRRDFTREISLNRR